MGSVKRELTSGVFYTAIAKYSGIIVQILVSAVLAHLIAPKDFGIISVATVFIAFFNILTDIGIGPAIVQRKDLTNEDLDQIFSVTAYTGCLCALIFFFGAGWIGRYYRSPQLVHVCQLLAIPMIIDSLDIVPNGLLFKAKRFKFIARRTLSAQIISGFGAIIAAFLGLGLYALLFSPIISSLILFTVTFKEYPRHFHVKINNDSIKKIFSFSIYQFLFNFINYFSRNLDKLLIGKFLGMAPLGYYDKSYRLMMWPLQNITFVITPAFQPVFSEYQDDYHKLSYYYMKVIHYLSWIAFPLTVLLFNIGKEAILLLFGHQWENAVPVFQILSVSVFMQILISTTGSIYQSANATRQLFISGVWGAIFIVIGFSLPIFLFHTIEAVAYGYLIAQVANFIQCFGLLFKTLDYPIKNFLKVLFHPFCFSCMLAILFTFLSILCNSMPLILSLMLKCFIWTFVCSVYVQYFKIFNIKSLLVKFFNQLRNK